MRIVLIEDNPGDARLVREILKETRGDFTIHVAERLEEGSKLLLSQDVDVILLDLNLPDSRGLATLTALQSRFPRPPIVIMTSIDDEELGHQAVRLGAQDYLVKGSVNAELLRRALAYAIERKQAEEELRSRQMELHAANGALRDSRRAALNLMEDALAARQRAEQTSVELRQSEERFRIIVESVQDYAIFMLDPKGNVASWNAGAERIKGYKAEEIVGRSFSTFYPPEDIERGRPAWELDAATRDGRMANEGWRVRKDGSRFWADVVITALRDEAGNLRGFSKVTRDITERKRAEQERETAVEFLRLVNESQATDDLIHAATDFLRRKSGCEAVGIRLADGDDYPYYETKGFSEEFVQLENSLCARDLNGQLLRDDVGNPVIECMCGNVICGRFNPSKPFFTARGSFWTNGTTELLATTTEADRQARTRDRCNGEGYESVALIGLRVGDERLGLLQLNDKRKGCFAPETIALWERLADYLAVALSKFAVEEELRASNEALSRFNRAAVDRELRMVQLKKQVNELSERLGQPPPYSLEFADDE